MAESGGQMLVNSLQLLQRWTVFVQGGSVECTKMNTIHILQNELEGAIELNLKKEATKVAGLMLASPQLNSAQLETVIVALTNFRKKSQKWQRAVETAFGRLTAGEKKETGSALFDYYFGIIELRKARQLWEKHGPFRKPTAMDVLKEFADQAGLWKMAVELEPYLCKPHQGDDGEDGGSNRGWE